jgi:hypothetical protein
MRNISQWMTLGFLAGTTIILSRNVSAQESVINSDYVISEIDSKAGMDGEIDDDTVTKVDIDEENDDESEKKAIQKVVLSTGTEDIFDFILDPYQLINMTDAVAYEGKRFEEGATLFFKRSDGRVKEDYSSVSDEIVITNKGDVPVEIELTARFSSLGKVVVTDDGEFKKDKKANIYLALTDGKNTVPIDDDGAAIHVIIPAVTDGENEYSFWLTGSANKNGDWEALTDIVPKVTVAWDIKPNGAAMEAESAIQDEDTDMELPSAAEEESPLDVSGINAPENVNQ